LPFLYYLLLIVYAGQFLHHLSHIWSAAAFLHVFFSLCIEIYSYFAERFGSQMKKVQLVTVSYFGLRHLVTDHTQPLYLRVEITLNQKRWNKHSAHTAAVQEICYAFSNEKGPIISLLQGDYPKAKYGK